MSEEQSQEVQREQPAQAEPSTEQAEVQSTQEPEPEVLEYRKIQGEKDRVLHEKGDIEKAYAREVERREKLEAQLNTVRDEKFKAEVKASNPHLAPLVDVMDFSGMDTEDVNEFCEKATEAMNLKAQTAGAAPIAPTEGATPEGSEVGTPPAVATASAPATDVNQVSGEAFKRMSRKEKREFLKSRNIGNDFQNYNGVL